MSIEFQIKSIDHKGEGDQDREKTSSEDADLLEVRFDDCVIKIYLSVITCPLQTREGWRGFFWGCSSFLCHQWSPLLHFDRLILYPKPHSMLEMN